MANPMTAEKIRDAKTWRLRYATGLDETRVRFNWGYHDGAYNQTNRVGRPDNLTIHDIRDKHFDPAYAEGYVAGFCDGADGRYHGNSETAWVNANHLPALQKKYADYRKQ